MSQAITKIKSRIKSVSGAYKVTSAMKLVSTVKLKQWRNKMLSHKEYVLEVNNIVDLLLKCSEKVSSPFMNININATKNLYVVITSTLGLCGSYNSNIFRVGDNIIKDNDDVIILGGKGITHYKNSAFHKIEGFDGYNSIADMVYINHLCKFIFEKYQKGEYKEVHIIYTEYKNSLAFIAKDFKLLPLKLETQESNVGYPPIMEPNGQELVNEVIPFYLESVVFSKLLESSVCEQGARSNAMENATSNAEEILNELQIEFNKERQAAITQEIIEIVAASKAV